MYKIVCTSNVYSLMTLDTYRHREAIATIRVIESLIISKIPSSSPHPFFVVRVLNVTVNYRASATNYIPVLNTRVTTVNTRDKDASCSPLGAGS